MQVVVAQKLLLVVREGETEYWDEFSPHNEQMGAIEDGVAAGARIVFGTSFDGVIDLYNGRARKSSLLEVAVNSRNEGLNLHSVLHQTAENRVCLQHFRRYP